MRCIYATNLKWPWGVLRTCTIIKNMKLWAGTQLRSRVASCLTMMQLKNYAATTTSSQDLRNGKKSLRVDVGSTSRRQSIESPTDYSSEPHISSKYAPVSLFDLDTRAASPGSKSNPKTTSKAKSLSAWRSRKSEPIVPLQSIDETALTRLAKVPKEIRSPIADLERITGMRNMTSLTRTRFRTTMETMKGKKKRMEMKRRRRRRGGGGGGGGGGGEEEEEEEEEEDKDEESVAASDGSNSTHEGTEETSDESSDNYVTSPPPSKS